MTIAQCVAQQLMAYVTDATHICVRFGDPVGECLDFHAAICARNLKRKRFHLLAHAWIGVNGQAQAVAKGIAGCAVTAMWGLRPGAGLRILAVCLNPAVACQFVLPLAGSSRPF